MMRRFVRIFAADSRGTGAIELALLAPMLALFVIGMVDVSLGIASKLRLEQAAQRAVEKATSYGSAGSDFSDIDDEAAAAGNVPVSEVTFDQWLECNGVRQTDFHGICAAGQEIARFVSVSINSGYTPLFSYGPLERLVDETDDGRVPISADASVRIQ